MPHFRSDLKESSGLPAHRQRQSPRPSLQIDPESEEVQILLERLDDAVFAALSGCESSLGAARDLWPQVVAALGWELVDESREQYLRFAIETTIRLQREESRSPTRSVAALEIISMLAR